jgi:hypothetical protein
VPLALAWKRAAILSANDLEHSDKSAIPSGKGPQAGPFFLDGRRELN